MLAVVGCGGGSQQPAPAPPPPPIVNIPGNPELPPAPELDCDAIASQTGSPNLGMNVLPGGVWDGSITNVTRKQNSFIQAMVGEHGRFALTYYPSNAAVSGSMDILGDEFAGVGLAFADQGDTWSDGSAVTEFATAGQISERASITGTWSTASGDSGCFELDRYYDYAYEEMSAVNLLAGLWLGDPDLSVNQDGSFFGQDSSGCSWNGEFRMIDAQYNMYDVVAEISGCGKAGQYTGLAYRDYVFVPERALLMAINDSNRFIRLHLDD
ncbi:MAG: hypothetical protein R3192_14500 [Woeseiaceae bacterium]|nr:hypothetical protein [Woeseiaceae bacterium]